MLTRNLFTLGVAALALTACNLVASKPEPDEETQAAVDAETREGATAENPQDAAPATFDVANVPESTAIIPDFPLFEDLEGLTNNFPKARILSDFDRAWFVAGDAPVMREGKLFQARYNLNGERDYSKLEFHRSYEARIEELGGIKVASQTRSKPIRQAIADRGGEATGCLNTSCNGDHYLIRKGGKEWWITVGTHRDAQRGFVTVLETSAMTNRLAVLDADTLKSKLDADGRVPVYIEFDVDRATIRPSAAPALKEIVTLLDDHPELRLSIDGHTDDTGTASRNAALSKERAAAVKQRLVGSGISESRLKTAGYGASKPLVDGTSDDARARNRRVELVKL